MIIQNADTKNLMF